MPHEPSSQFHFVVQNNIVVQIPEKVCATYIQHFSGSPDTPIGRIGGTLLIERSLAYNKYPEFAQDYGSDKFDLTLTMERVRTENKFRHLDKNSCVVSWSTLHSVGRYDQEKILRLEQIFTIALLDTPKVDTRRDIMRVLFMLVDTLAEFAECFQNDSVARSALLHEKSRVIERTCEPRTHGNIKIG